MKLTANHDKVGTIGLFLAALATPCCFPLFGFLLAAFGLGTAELFGSFTEYIFQILVLISLIGTFITYRQHKKIFPLLIALASGGLIVYAYNFSFDSKTIYTGMFGLLASAGLNYYINRKQNIACSSCTVVEGKTVELNSTITCPNCGHKKTETMPTDACQFFYQCDNCKTNLKPNKGDCCVYCSFGTVKCPSMQ